MDIGPSELLIVLIVLLVVFGGSKIPKLARNLGQAQSEFKKGLSQGEQAAATPVATPATEAPVVVAPPVVAPTVEAPGSFLPPPPRTPGEGSGSTAV